MTVGIQHIVEAATGCSPSPGKRRRVNTAKANGNDLNKLLMLLDIDLSRLIGYILHYVCV